jgi:hypothetical protein
MSVCRLISVENAISFVSPVLIASAILFTHVRIHKSHTRKRLTSAGNAGLLHHNGVGLHRVIYAHIRSLSADDVSESTGSAVRI